jgi:hypothetical protein
MGFGCMQLYVRIYFWGSDWDFWDALIQLTRSLMPDY